MRDPKRIDKICEALKKRWKLEPDLRLGQLMSNLIPQDYWRLIEDEDTLALIEKDYKKTIWWRYKTLDEIEQTSPEDSYRVFLMLGMNLERGLISFALKSRSTRLISAENDESRKEYAGLCGTALVFKRPDREQNNCLAFISDGKRQLFTPWGNARFNDEGLLELESKGKTYLFEVGDGKEKAKL